MPTSIDVVIVAYNRYELTESCLRHLRAQTVAHRVIVVDNGSTDGTRARVGAGVAGGALERFEDNRGFAEACNRGVAAGSGEIVVLLNNDVDCRPDFLERLMAPFAQDPQVGARRGADAPAGRAADRQRRACRRRDAWRVSAASGARCRTGALRAAGPGRSGGHGRRLPPLGMGAGRRTGRGDLRLHGGLRPRPAPAQLPAGRRSWPPTRWACTWARPPTGTARPGSDATAASGAVTCCAATGCCAAGTRAAALATEAIVVLGDLAISRDLAALRGRLSGWRAGGDRPRLPRPPADAIDSSVSFRDSLALRRGVYGRRAA